MRGCLGIDGELSRHASSRAARKEVATNAVAALHAVSRRFWYYYRDNSLLADEPLDRHAELAAAIDSGDENPAAAASHSLVDQLLTFARSTLPDN